MWIKYFSLICVLAVVAGCAALPYPKSSDERPLPGAVFEPTGYELNGNPMQVMLQINVPNKDELQLQKELIAHYQSILIGNGVTLDDMSSRERGKLEKAILLAEKNGRGDYHGKASVNYYLRGTLIESSFEKTYSSPIWCPFCDERRPGTCDYKQKASLFLEAYKLPSNQRVKSWRVSDEASESFDANGSCHRSAEQIDTQALSQTMQGSIAKSLKECIEDSLIAFLAPEAFIKKYYSDGEKHYFEISAGSGAGFHKNDSVQISRQRTTEQGGGSMVLGEAEVTSLVEPQRAIIEISDRKLVNNIHLYDKVKVLKSRYSLGLSCMGKVEEM